MHRSAAAFLCSLWPAASLAAPAVTIHGPPATAAAILRTERAFEALSEQQGAATAFRTYMDPMDGLEFGGGAPVRGAASIGAVQARAPAGAVLSWVPKEVFASTGDMGVVWGTWSFTTPHGKRAVTGRYVTVWRQDGQGAWKAIVDIGTPDS